MRIYRCILVILMVAAIGFGVWYCTYSINEQRSIKDGTLVFYEFLDENETNMEKNYLRGVIEHVSNHNLC